MRKFLKKSLLLVGVFLLMAGLVGCSQTGSNGGSTSEDLVLKNLQAVSGTELEATFSNGETKSITNFNPKPLEVGEETEVSFNYEGTSYSKEINYEITINGSLSDTSQKIMAASDTSEFTVEDIAKVVLFFGEEYKTADVENGKFNITIDEKSPGGIAFVDSDNNYIGYLSLPDGLDSIPTQAISDETGEIDLGEISFTEDGIGEPSEDPFAEMDDTEKSSLAVAGSFMSAALRSPEIIEKMVNGQREISFGLKYFPFANEFNENRKGVLSDTNLIAAHRLEVEYEPGLSDYNNLTLTYPKSDKFTDGNSVPVDLNSETAAEGVQFPGVGVEKKAAEVGPPIPPSGEYNVSGSGLDFNFILPDIQDEAKNNLVFPVPKVSVSSEGIIQEISLEYKTSTGETIIEPENILEYVDIQINAISDENEDLEGDYTFTEHSKTRIYNSGSLNPGETSHKIEGETIYWEDIGNIDIAYDDIYKIHYVISYNR